MKRCFFGLAVLAAFFGSVGQAQACRFDFKLSGPAMLGIAFVFLVLVPLVISTISGLMVGGIIGSLKGQSAAGVRWGILGGVIGGFAAEIGFFTLQLPAALEQYWLGAVVLGSALMACLFALGGVTNAPGDPDRRWDRNDGR